MPCGRCSDRKVFAKYPGFSVGIFGLPGELSAAENIPLTDITFCLIVSRRASGVEISAKILQRERKLASFETIFSKRDDKRLDPTRRVGWFSFQSFGEEEKNRKSVHAFDYRQRTP